MKNASTKESDFRTAQRSKIGNSYETCKEAAVSIQRCGELKFGIYEDKKNDPKKESDLRKTQRSEIGYRAHQKQSMTASYEYRKIGSEFQTYSTRKSNIKRDQIFARYDIRIYTKSKTSKPLIRLKL